MRFSFILFLLFLRLKMYLQYISYVCVYKANLTLKVLYGGGGRAKLPEYSEHELLSFDYMVFRLNVV